MGAGEIPRSFFAFHTKHECGVTGQ